MHTTHIKLENGKNDKFSITNKSKQNNYFKIQVRKRVREIHLDTRKIKEISINMAIIIIINSTKTNIEQHYTMK